MPLKLPPQTDRIEPSPNAKAHSYYLWNETPYACFDMSLKEDEEASAEDFVIIENSIYIPAEITIFRAGDGVAGRSQTHLLYGWKIYTYPIDIANEISLIYSIIQKMNNEILKRQALQHLEEIKFSIGTELDDELIEYLTDFDYADKYGIRSDIISQRLTRKEQQ